MKDKVETLDLIQTGKNSNARVVLTDASAMALGPNTKLEMKQFDIQGTKTTGLFYVPMGLVQTNIAKALGPGSKFEMQTPTAIAGVRGTAWITLVEPMLQAGVAGSQSTFYGLAQTISVFNTALPTQVMTVAAGNFTVVAAGVAPTVAAAFVPATVAGLTSTLGAAAIPGVAAGVGAGAAAVGTTGAVGAGTAAGTATVAGIGTGTIAAGVVAAAAVAAAVAATTSAKTDTTPAHTTTSRH
ncbi:MAG: FecR domain-containing protein [Pseudomonadota bacterium]|nr:FecR domain-containing protein [Pseudomonadota bacterium]